MIPILSTRNRQILVDQTQLVDNAVEETYLTADITAASGTLTVAGISGFAINKNLLINPFGENAEFVKTHTSTAPTGSTITLVANTTYAHYAGEKVFLVDYNQIELAHTTTTTGTKTALVTTTLNGLVALDADLPNLIYPETEYNSGYYFGRFVNSIGITFTVSGETFTASTHGLQNGETVKLIGATTLATGLSTTITYYVVQRAAGTFKLSLTNGGVAVTASDAGSGTQTAYRAGLYSDPLIYSGWASNTVGFMIDRALADLGLEFSEKVTSQDCYEWINAGMRLVQGKLKRWPEHYSYNAVLGQVSRGTNTVAMPTDAYDRETNKSLIALRIGTGANLTYVPPTQFENIMEGVKVTQVTTQAVANQVTLEIDNSYDFEDSGSVDFFISGTKYTVTYTGVTRSATAGILTGVPASGTGSISVTVPVDTNIWQSEVEGRPEVFTIRNSNIEFYPLADGNEDNKNMYGDYSKVCTSVDSDGDVIDFQRGDMLENFLKWRMKMKAKNDGELDMKDGYYLSFKECLNDSVRTLPQNNIFPMSPKINRMSKHPNLSWMRKANLQDLPISDQ